jgi:hypothetical protein
LGIDSQGSRGGSAVPFCSGSIEIASVSVRRAGVEPAAAQRESKTFRNA